MRTLNFRLWPLLLLSVAVLSLTGSAPGRTRVAARRALLHALLTRDDAKVATRKDVAYYEGAGADATRHKLDLYLPEGKQNFPILLFIHGGAWKNGSKDLYGRLGQTFASQGIGVAVANYRLSPGVQHPEHIKDVARSFAWVYKHCGELGADSKRVYICGHSAGGHLVALLALDPRYLKEQGLGTDAIRGVVGISGPYSLPPDLFPEVFGDDAARRADAFPINHVKDQEGKRLPEFLILFADKDYAGLPMIGKQLGADLTKEGGRATVVEIADRDHISIVGRLGQPDDPAGKQIVTFIHPWGRPASAAPGTSSTPGAWRRCLPRRTCASASIRRRRRSPACG